MTKKNFQYSSSKHAPSSLENEPFYGFELDDEQKLFRNAIYDSNNIVVVCDSKAGTGANFAEVWSIGTTGNGDHAHNVATNANWTGGNNDATSTASSNALEAHTNLQPYITCYMFKRTA